jgi:apolipoprotein N-acyltransferase
MKRELGVGLSGLGMGLATPPISASFFAYISLIPLWWCLVNPLASEGERVSKGRYKTRSPWVLGAIWGLGYHGLALFWITGVHPLTWMGIDWWASLVIAVFCWLAITLWGMVLTGLWAGSFAWLIARCKLGDKSGNTAALTRREGDDLGLKLIRVLLGTTLWCLGESLWSRGILWWSSLALTQSPHNLYLLQWSQFSGYITVVASIVALNGLLAEVGMAGLQRQIWATKFLGIVIIALLILLYGGGSYLYDRPVEKIPSEQIKVGIIQGNIPNTIKLYPEGWRRAITGYTTGYRTLAQQGVEVVLTPETALPYRWQDIVTNSEFYRAILQEKIPVWLGAFGQRGDRLTNSLFTVTETGEQYSQFDKVKLVPLGEYIPLSQWFGQWIGRLSPLEANLATGSDRQRFSTPWGVAAVGICYESAFAEHFRRQIAEGAEFILSVANNAHYSPTMPAQHHAQDVMRAIEGDRWLARATNTGYSAIIDPRGRTLWRSTLDQYEIYGTSIYRQQTITPFVRWGNWLTPVLGVLTALGIGIRKVMGEGIGR